LAASVETSQLTQPYPGRQSGHRELLFCGMISGAMGNVVAQCPACGHQFEPPRKVKLKLAVTTAGVGGGAWAGASIGSGIGLASGGAAMAATVPLGALLGVVGGLGAKAGADWALAKAVCPQEGCGIKFRL
jgi:hypothetical protein